MRSILLFGAFSLLLFSCSASTPSSSLSSQSQETSLSSSNSQPEVGRNALDEPYLGRQYYLNHIGDIYSSWRQYRGKGVTIAVIDAGFNPDHEDFCYADGTSKVSPKSASFVTNGGKTETSVGVSYVKNMGESHGTFCAGVAGAAINGKGVCGIAPEAELLLLRTDCKPLSIAKAFHYAADEGAKVITISIGSYYDYGGDLQNDGSDLATVFNEPVSYCREKGVVVCSAAGNGGLEGKPTEYTFPGCVDGVIGVGGLAANSSGEIWSGTSYNSSSAYRFADVFAPSDGMFGCCHYDGKLYDGGWQGTSFASPIVAGMAALYFEAFPSRSDDDFERDLYSSSELFDSEVVSRDQIGYGRVNVGKLLGVSANETVDVAVTCDWSNCYCYAWNEEKQKEIAPWPGVAMTKNGSNFSTKIALGEFESLLFTGSSEGPQSVDLRASSFLFGKTYDLSQPVKEQGCLICSYR